ncbi:hypothetical protein [uncultured Bradyrhizobium sp.]|uniref:hypothetical protein n=1 Tax=uncultured Bradyrhizobium sp. TaxID=199684 RepID=UPI00262E3369|nr:hypothetical protein [uncultured Bradyrhizobium sp.]
MAWMNEVFPGAHMTPFRFGSTGIALVLASSGCSEQPRKANPTEQEIHAGDSGDASGIPGRHPYRCDDDRLLLVDFKNEGLTLELRRDGNAAPVVLTAPAPGLQYIGDTMSATFSGNELKIEEGDKPPVLCRKDTSL